MGKDVWDEVQAAGHDETGGCMICRAYARGRLLERVAEAARAEIIGNDLLRGYQFRSIRAALLALDGDRDGGGG